MSQERLSTVSFNNQVRAYWIRNWIYNAVANWPRLQKYFERYGEQALIGSLQRKNKEPAIILGAGPSTDLILPHIQRWNGALFVPNSLAKWSDAVGRHADYICAIDCSQEIGEDLKGPHFYRSALLTHPCVDSSVFENFKGPLKLFRMFEPGNDTINNLFASLYNWVSGYVVNSGCIGNSLVLLASLLGYSPLYILGIDYSYPEDRVRFQDFKYRGNFAYLPKKIEMLDRTDPREVEQIIHSDEGIITTKTNIFYKQTFLCNYKLTGMQVVNMSPTSILKPELPFASVEDVINSQFDKKLQAKLAKLHRSRKEIDDIVDNYCIPRGIFAKYDPETNAILGIEIIGEQPQRLEEKRRELKMMEEHLGIWEKPTPEKPYWTRKDVPNIKKPKWSWEELVDTHRRHTSQDELKSLTGEDAAEGGRAQSTGIVYSEATASLGSASGVHGSTPPASPDSSDEQGT